MRTKSIAVWVSGFVIALLTVFSALILRSSETAAGAAQSIVTHISHFDAITRIPAIPVLTEHGDTVGVVVGYTGAFRDSSGKLQPIYVMHRGGASHESELGAESMVIYFDPTASTAAPRMRIGHFHSSEVIARVLIEKPFQLVPLVRAPTR